MYLMESGPGPTAAAAAKIMAVIVLAIATTYRHIRTIWTEGTLPLYLAIIWTVLGFMAGHILWPAAITTTEAVNGADLTLGDDTRAETSVAATRESPSVAATRESPLQHGQNNGAAPSLATGTNSDSRRKKRDALKNLLHKASGFLPLTGTYSRSCDDEKTPSSSSYLPGLSGHHADIWTTLEGKVGRAKAYWEEHVYDKPTSELAERLLEYPDFSTKPSEEPGTMAVEPAADNSAAEGGYGTFADIEDDERGAKLMKTIRVGHVDTGSVQASVLQRKVEVDPLFKLRGMDVFRTATPEERIWRQPILEK